MSEQRQEALRRLELDGLIESDGEAFRTTRRWQGAMARAAKRLYDSGDPGDDLRVPIAAALVEVYTSTVDDDELVHMVAAMLPIEARALGLSGR